jgi:hypothetical protein
LHLEVKPMRLRLAITLPLLGLTACGRLPTGAVLSVAPVQGPVRLLAASPDQATPQVVEAPAAGQALALIVYNNDLGLVRDTRHVSLPAGGLTLRFPGVSPQLESTSARLLVPEGASAPDVREQTFLADVLTPGRLLERYVGKTVEVRLPAEGNQPSKIVEATLLSTEGPVVRIGDRVYLKPPGDLVLPDLPAGLPTTPTLEWRLQASGAFKGAMTASYMTRALSWRADYALTLGAGGLASLQGWAAVTNQTDVEWPNARLTVVAGDLPGPRPFYERQARLAPAPAQDSFTQSDLGEFHRYDLEGRVTLPRQQTKALKLLGSDTVAVEKTLRFDTPGIDTIDYAPRPAQVFMAFKNEAAQGLGVPLPAGRVRIYQGAALLSEDSIANTPKDETVTLSGGNAFDVVGQHAVLPNASRTKGVARTAVQVVLRNHKAKPVTVEVVEHPTGAAELWEIQDNTHPFTIVDRSKVVFKLKVPASGEVTLKFTLRTES